MGAVDGAASESQLSQEQSCAATKNIWNLTPCLSLLRLVFSRTVWGQLLVASLAAIRCRQTLLAALLARLCLLDLPAQVLDAAGSHLCICHVNCSTEGGQAGKADQINIALTTAMVCGAHCTLPPPPAHPPTHPTPTHTEHTVRELCPISQPASQPPTLPISLGLPSPSRMVVLSGSTHSTVPSATTPPFLSSCTLSPTTKGPPE